MKNILFTFCLTFIFCLHSNYTHAQQDEWLHDHDRGIYSVGPGVGESIIAGNGPVYISPPGITIHLAGEYCAYKFLGVGWQAGIDYYFFTPGYRSYSVNGVPESYSTKGFAVPLMAKVNVHILSAIGGLSIADDLDVYAGINLGAGPMILGGDGYRGKTIAAAFKGGAAVGVRYWVGRSIAVFGEFGYGANFAQIGITW